MGTQRKNFVRKKTRVVGWSVRGCNCFTYLHCPCSQIIVVYDFASFFGLIEAGFNLAVYFLQFTYLRAALLYVFRPSKRIKIKLRWHIGFDLKKTLFF